MKYVFKVTNQMYLPRWKLKGRRHYKTFQRTPGLWYAHPPCILVETVAHLIGLYCCNYNLSSAKKKKNEQTVNLVITRLIDSSVLSKFLQFVRRNCNHLTWTHDPLALWSKHVFCSHAWNLTGDNAGSWRSSKLNYVNFCTPVQEWLK